MGWYEGSVFLSIGTRFHDLGTERVWRISHSFDILRFISQVVKLGFCSIDVDVLVECKEI